VIGDRLKEVRKDHGDTQQTVANKLQVSKYTIQSWEQGKSEPSHELLICICRLYQVSADYLLGLSDEDPLYVPQCSMQILSPENQALLQRFKSFLLKQQEKDAKKRTANEGF